MRDFAIFASPQSISDYENTVAT